MIRNPALRRLLQRHFGVFIGTWFTSLVAIAWSFVLVWSSWFRSAGKDELRWTLIGLVLVLMLGHGAVVRGRKWGAWIVAGVCALCAVLVLSLYGQRPNMLLFGASLLFALVTLLLINSKRYREMCEAFAQERAKRREHRQAGRRR